LAKVVDDGKKGRRGRPNVRKRGWMGE